MRPEGRSWPHLWAFKASAGFRRHLSQEVRQKVHGDQGALCKHMQKPKALAQHCDEDLRTQGLASNCHVSDAVRARHLPNMGPATLRGTTQRSGNLQPLQDVPMTCTDGLKSSEKT